MLFLLSRIFRHALKGITFAFVAFLFSFQGTAAARSRRIDAEHGAFASCSPSILRGVPSLLTSLRRDHVQQTATAFISTAYCCSRLAVSSCLPASGQLLTGCPRCLFQGRFSKICAGVCQRPPPGWARRCSRRGHGITLFARGHSRNRIFVERRGPRAG